MTSSHWQQNTRKHPGHYDVFARPTSGGDAFKVNAAGTQGANGGIEGDLLVYEQFDRGRSDLKFFDLGSKDRTSPPGGVNTRRWEFWPTYLDSGSCSAVARKMSHARSSCTTSRPAMRPSSTRSGAETPSWRPDRSTATTPSGTDAHAAPSATWSCTASATGVETKIPNPGGFQYAPSVSPDGTVTFARSASGCGNRVRLIRDPLNGPSSVLWQLPTGGDVSTTRVHVGTQGNATLYFDNFACGQPAASDVWQILEGGTTQLTVKVEGSGSVTSSPAGINCGSDCTETYDPGTGVTLTAAPQAGTTFAGWGGACTGTSTTCTLTMSAARSVTATFTTKPVLTVTKSGSGRGTV